jgi:hypothetical protein
MVPWHGESNFKESQKLSGGGNLILVLSVVTISWVYMHMLNCVYIL